MGDSSMMVNLFRDVQTINANIFLEERGCGEQADFCIFKIYWHKL
jgi:hypothetical protein